MYDKHFKLTRLPFTPDASPEALFLGPCHRESLAVLEWGLSEPSGFTLLLGVAGMGKTTLVRALLGRSHPGVFTVMIPDPTLSFPVILVEVSTRLGLEVSELDKLQLLGGLYKLHLLKGLKDSLQKLEAERLVIIFDEAQDLPDESLDQVRFLSNMAEPELLKIILVAQPRLMARLETERFTALNQRIGARAVLNPLSDDELADYLEYRLRAAGSNSRRLFERKALRRLINQSEGCPRRANMIAHNAIVLAFSRAAKRVVESDVKAAVEDYDHPLPYEGAFGAPLPRKQGQIRRLMPSRGVGWAAALAGVAASVAGYHVLRSDVGTSKSDYRPAAVAHADSAETSAQSSLSQHETNRAPVKTPLADLSPSRGTPSTGALRQDPPHRRVSPRRVSAHEPRRRITVRSGDTLQLISRDHLGRDDAAGIARLLNANPQIRDADFIYPGQIIYLDPRTQVAQGSSR
jgi:type II secretory pathway predicted ATPase ExeA